MMFAFFLRSCQCKFWMTRINLRFSLLYLYKMNWCSMKLTRILGIVIILIISGSFSFQKVDYRNAMHKNVCKSLRNNALVFIIFVDNKTTTPWTEFDIRSTMDSVAVVRKWMMDQAKKYSVPLNVQTDYYIGKDFTTISKNLPGGSVYKTATTPNFKKGLLELNAWSDW